MNIEVISETELRCGGISYRCAVGKGGFIAPEDKREGDLKTPTGVYPLREVWYRPDKLARPRAALPVRAIAPDDGWCDDPAQPGYNRPFSLSPETQFSHERLWRDDDCYDLVVPLGYNDDPPVAGRGSAIFMHVAKPGYTGTEGCVALKKEDLLAILTRVTIESRIDIVTDKGNRS